MAETPVPPDVMPSLDDFLCFAIYATSHAFTRVYKPLLDPLGLTYPQYLVMVALWERDDQTVGSIGDKLSLESSTLTPLLKRLETANYLRRSRDPDDERQVRVQLSDAGRALRERANAIPNCILAASGMSLGQLQRLQSETMALCRALQASRTG